MLTKMSILRGYWILLKVIYLGWQFFPFLRQVSAAGYGKRRLPICHTKAHGRGHNFGVCDVGNRCTALEHSKDFNNCYPQFQVDGKKFKHCSTACFLKAETHGTWFLFQFGMLISEGVRDLRDFRADHIRVRSSFHSTGQSLQTHIRKPTGLSPMICNNVTTHYISIVMQQMCLPVCNQ